MSPFAWTPLTLLLVAASVADSPPATAVDLPALIECRGEIADYTQMAMKLADEKSAKQLGWAKVEQPNPFLAEYRLPKAITVFGTYKTRRVALGASGVLAILEGKQASPSDIAARLRLEAVPAGATRNLFARVVKQTSDDVTSVLIRLNVSNIDSHPGKTFAGCEYQVTVK